MPMPSNKLILYSNIESELDKHAVEAGWEEYWDNPNGSPTLPECQFYMLGWYRAMNADNAALKEMSENYGFYERSGE